MHIVTLISSAVLNSCLALNGIHEEGASAARWINADSVQTFEKVVSGHNNNNHNHNHNKLSSQSISRASMLS